MVKDELYKHGHVSTSPAQENKMVPKSVMSTLSGESWTGLVEKEKQRASMRASQQALNSKGRKYRKATHRSPLRPPPMDSTIRLFESMPRGFEYYEENGPLKAMKDNYEYKKLDANHKRILGEHNEFGEDDVARMFTHLEKTDHFLRNVMKNEASYQENYRKYNKAWAMYSKARMLISDSLPEIEKLKRERTLLSKINNRLEKICNQYEVYRFLEMKLSKMTAGKFRSIHDCIARHGTLTDSLKYQMARMFEGKDILDNLTKIYLDLKASNRNNILDMKDQILTLNTKLYKLQTDNRVLTKNLNDYESQRSRVMADRCALQNGLSRMFQYFMVYRPFTSRRISNAETEIDKVQEIGNILQDYKTIIDEIQRGNRKHRVRRRSTKTGLDSTFVPATDAAFVPAVHSKTTAKTTPSSDQVKAPTSDQVKAPTSTEKVA